jgi:trigger factor
VTQTRTSEPSPSQVSDLQVSVSVVAAWSRKLVVTVPGSRVRRVREGVVAGIARRVRRPGFRKGHVPRWIVEREYAREIDRETLERVVEEAFREAVAREGLEPITEGAIEVLRWEGGASEADLVFAATFDVRPEIELKRLGGFRIVGRPVEVTEAEVDAVLAELREAHGAWRPVERSPRAGDKVAVVLTPLDEGGGEVGPRRYEFRLGRGHAVPDVERALGTLVPGAEGEFAVSVPEGASESAGGGGARRVRLRLEAVWELELPALDDAFAREVSDVESLAALRDRIREGLRREKEAEERERVRNEILDRILEANPFEVPESMVRRSLDALLRPPADAPPEALERVRERYRPAALRGIKKTLVVQRVAELQGLEATPEEVDARVAELARRAGRSVEEVRRRLERAGELRELRRRITEEKVLAYLEGLSTVG